jgi:phosphoglycolate phosphatase-like HAD superfamily hydrolase
VLGSKLTKDAKLVIFDCDGVLVDSEMLAARSNLFTSVPSGLTSPLKRSPIAMSGFQRRRCPG